MKHENNGACGHCREIFYRYPGFNAELFAWVGDMQKRYPEFHISCAGRGQVDQEAYFQRGATRAHWKHSAHNWNAAVDIFCNAGGDLYDREWFHRVVGNNVPPWASWYGAPGAPFPELPHVEVRNWHDLILQNKLSLVE